MPRPLTFVVVAAAALTASLPLAGSAHAQEPAAPAQPWPDFWSIQLENDRFGGGRTDRYYTHGMEFSYMVPGAPPEWLAALAELIPVYRLNRASSAVNYAVGMKIFTPEDTAATALVPDDRPYAGYTFVSAALLSRFSTSADLDVGNIFSIEAGVIGPSSRAGAFQRSVHRALNVDVPQGWRNELRDEPTLDVGYTRVWNAYQTGESSVDLCVSPHLTIEIGSVDTYVAGGVMFRLGTQLRDSFSPPAIRPGFPGASYFRPSPDFEWYLFAGHETRLVSRDAFLDGNLFKDSHAINKERLLGEYQFGFAFQIGRVRIALSVMYRTAEFEGQPDLTRYGALNVSVASE